MTGAIAAPPTATAPRRRRSRRLRRGSTVARQAIASPGERKRAIRSARLALQPRPSILRRARKSFGRLRAARLVPHDLRDRHALEAREDRNVWREVDRSGADGQVLVARAVIVVDVKVRDYIAERRDQLGGVLVDRGVPGVETHSSVRAECGDD